MDENNQLSYVLSQLSKRDLGITTKNDPTMCEAPSYYEIDEYGDLTDKGSAEILSDVNDYIGDGAINFQDATDMWIEDAYSTCRVDYKDNLRTQFKPKQVVDQIEAFETPKHLTEGKSKKELSIREITDWIEQTGHIKMYNEYASRKENAGKPIPVLLCGFYDWINSPEAPMVGDLDWFDEEEDKELKKFSDNISEAYEMTPIPKDLQEPSKAKPWTENMWQEYYQRMNSTVRDVYKIDGDNSDYIKKQMERFNIDLELNKENLKVIADKIAEEYANEKERKYKSLNESVAHRLEEENTKSANLISDMFKAKDFDSDSKQGQIVMRTSQVFNALSDLGYNIEVSFDNGESQSAILLGEQGGRAMITITDPDKPIRAFANGNFELTPANLEILDDISKQIQSL